MDLLNIVVLVIFIAFLIFEGKNALFDYKTHKQLVKECLDNKKDAVLCKDYKNMIIIYTICGILLTAYAIYYIVQGLYVFGGVFLLMPLFCVVFILEAMITRTIVFYETGFLYAGRNYKYRSILKISEKKKFIRGYHVQLINDENLVYVTKNLKPVLEEKMKEFKNRKKNKHEK